MPYTMEDFRRDYVKEHFMDLTPEEQREALKRLSPEVRREALKGLSPEERLEGLSLKERLEGLSPEEIERLLNKLKAEGSSRPRRRRRKD